MLEKLASTWPPSAVPKVKSLKVIEVDDANRLLVANEQVIGAQIGDRILPFVGADPEILRGFPSVGVDMGAVKFVCNGAKVMRPGITSLDEFREGDIVLVKDQVHGKVLAAGIALLDSEVARQNSKGYVIDNLHYISDNLWEEFKKI